MPMHATQGPFKHKKADVIYAARASNYSFAPLNKMTVARVEDDGSINTRFLVGGKLPPLGQPWLWRDVPDALYREVALIQGVPCKRYTSLDNYNHHVYWGMRSAGLGADGADGEGAAKAGKVSEFDAAFCIVRGAADAPFSHMFFLKGNAV